MAKGKKGNKATDATTTAPIVDESIKENDDVVPETPDESTDGLDPVLDTSSAGDDTDTTTDSNVVVDEPVVSEPPVVEETPPVQEETPTPPPVVESVQVVVEEVKAPAPEMICSWDRGIDGQLKTALNQLNSISSRDLAGICVARYMIYTNLFNGIALAATDEDAYSLLDGFLAAVAERPYVTAKDRALLGFLRMDKLTRQQATMYQSIWTVLIDTAVPATRKINSMTINWRQLGSMSGFHKRGDVIYRRLFAFYQRC